MHSRKENGSKRVKSQKIHSPKFDDEIKKYKRNLSLVQDNRWPGQKLNTVIEILVERAKHLKSCQDIINNKISKCEFAMLRKLQDLDLLSNQANKLEESFLEKSTKRKLAISAKDKEIQLLKKQLLNRRPENAKIDTE